MTERDIIDAPAPIAGCGSCAVKSVGNCSSHLTAVVPIIAEAFIDAKIIFNPADPDHQGVVAAILAEDIRDDQGNSVAYEVPLDPRVQTSFYDQITRHVTAALAPG